jgi:germination protein M
MVGLARRSVRSVLLAVVVAAMALLVGCGESSDTATTSEPPEPTEPTASESPDGSTPVAERVYFALGEVVGTAGRTLEVAGGAVARAAVDSLLEGPTDVESDAGMTTSIPDGTDLLDLAVSDGLATVDLSASFEDGGGSLSMQMRVAQVVYTLTQFDTIDVVEFRLDGTPVPSIGGEGVLVDPPVGRSDMEAVTPPVLVESVWPGLVASSPMPFSGTANTFEANVLWRVERPDGTLVAEGFTTATSGSGTRGTFSDEIDLAGETGDMVLVTGGEDAKRGGIAGAVRIPFTVEE